MSAGQGGGLPYQVEMLSDPWRMSYWKRAIEAVIRPGDVVLDVGTGTGILAVWAARAGASRVIAVEADEIATMAAQVVAHNGVADRVEVIHADLASLAPEGVDVILADFVGRLVPDGAMQRAVRAASAWSTPETRWMPSRVELRAALLGDVPVPALERVEHPILGVDMRAGLDRALATTWSMTVGQEALLGPPSSLGWMHPPQLEPSLHVQASLTGKGGVCRGILTWFRNELAPGICLDTGPGRRTFWGQTLWPLPRIKLPNTAVARVEGTLHSRPGAVAHDWSVRIHDGDALLLEHHVQDGRATGHAASPADPISTADRPRLSLPEALASGIPTDRDALAALITALYRVGDPAALHLLSTFERRFGPHPLLRPG